MKRALWTKDAEGRMTKRKPTDRNDAPRSERQRVFRGAEVVEDGGWEPVIGGADGPIDRGIARSSTGGADDIDIPSSPEISLTDTENDAVFDIDESTPNDEALTLDPWTAIDALSKASSSDQEETSAPGPSSAIHADFLGEASRAEDRAEDRLSLDVVGNVRPGSPFPDLPDDTASAKMTYGQISAELDAPISPELLMLLASSLNLRFHLSHRGCHHLLAVLKKALVAHQHVAPSVKFPETLNSAFRSLKLTDQFNIFPTCPNCRRIYPPGSRLDLKCSSCLVSLFKTKSTPQASTSASEPPSHDSEHTHTSTPVVQTPFRKLSHILGDFVVRPDIEDDIDVW
jgi:hypothetical protein